MAKTNFSNSTCNNYIDLVTEDGEIDDSLSAEIKRKEEEIENYYLSLNSLGCDLRCKCCGDVFKDPVYLSCQHLIDRSCAVIKRNGNIIECFQCHKPTICDEIDQLVTDVHIASRIPPKPNSSMAILNKNGDEEEDECYDSDGELTRPQKRQRRTRWNKIEPGTTTSFSGAIMEILSSNNLPKNITMAQFKKYTDLSSKPSVMSLLTKAVLQNVSVDGAAQFGSAGIADNAMTEPQINGTFSDAEILDLIPRHELEDLFDLEKLQFIMLYRDALHKGVISLPSLANNKATKIPLLPTPKHGHYSPQSSVSTHSHCSGKVPPTRSNNATKRLKKKVKKPPPKLPLPEETKTERTIIDDNNPTEGNIVTPLLDSGDCSKECLEGKVAEGEDNNRYRDSVNRLHSIYGTMYRASVTMKEFESQRQSADYQAAQQIYAETYMAYESLYSSLQPTINLESVSQHSLDTAGSIPLIRSPSDSTDNVAGLRVMNVRSLGPTHTHTHSPSDNKDKFGYLWISNLCKDTRTNDLHKLFGKFGHVSKIKLFQYKAQTPMAFFSLIFMPNMAEAESALRALDNSTLLERSLHIKMLSPPTNTTVTTTTASL